MFTDRFTNTSDYSKNLNLRNFGSDKSLDSTSRENLNRYASNLSQVFRNQTENIDKQATNDLTSTEAAFASRGIDLNSGVFSIALKNIEQSKRVAYQAARQMASYELDGAIQTEKERSSARFNNNLSDIFSIGQALTNPSVSNIVQLFSRFSSK